MHGTSDQRNVLVVVLSENDGLYEVGCREGTLNTKFTIADHEKLPEALIEPQSVPEVTVNLRTAVAKATGGQGYTKCTVKLNAIQEDALARKIICNVILGVILVCHAKMLNAWLLLCIV